MQNVAAHCRAFDNMNIMATIQMLICISKLCTNKVTERGTTEADRPFCFPRENNSRGRISVNFPSARVGASGNSQFPDRPILLKVNYTNP